MNCRVDEIVNLDIVRGSCYEKGQSFYEKLSVNYDALREVRMNILNWMGL